MNQNIQGYPVNSLNSMQNCFQWPYTYQSGTYVPPGPAFPTKIREVASGFIVERYGKEFVFESTETLLKFLEKEFIDEKLAKKLPATE